MSLEGIATHLLILTGTRVGKHMLKIIKKYMLRQIEKRTEIQVLPNGHFVMVGNAENPISFHIDIIGGTPAALKVNHVEYQIIYKTAVIQRGQWSGLIEMKDDAIRNSVNLLYYPLESPLGIPRLQNEWGIKGTININCLYGSFVKGFSSSCKLKVTSDGSWQDIRDTVKRIVEDG